MLSFARVLYFNGTRFKTDTRISCSKRNVSGNAKRLQQFEKECAPRIRGWTCDKA